MTRDLARYGIRVVTIAPSLFDSRMTAMMSDKVRASLTRVMEFPCMSLFLFYPPNRTPFLPSLDPCTLPRTFNVHSEEEESDSASAAS
jgi:NAD(P)-dependent dehydrogenase (short-subunit alcohol dehydrogenase family)